MVGASGSNVRMAMQYAVVTSTQINATTSMTYGSSNWNGNIFAAFKVGSSTSGSPVASLSPTSLSFVNQTVQTTSAYQTATLSNTGNAPLAISGIAMTGANSGDFAQTNNCGTTVAAGANCTINVTFTPTATGTRSGTLTVKDNSATSTQTASLSGTGAGTALKSLAPTSRIVSSQNVCTTSAYQAVILT